MTARSALIGVTFLALDLAGAGAMAADYEHMMAMSTTRLADMMAGPGNTAALISPDGTQMLHIGRGAMCRLDLTESGAWSQARCEERTAATRPGGPEDMFWSPKGTYLLWPSYTDAFLAFRDTDIQVFDSETFVLTNLTDDHFEGGLLGRMRGAAAHFDVSPQWMDDDTVAFLRYVIPEEGLQERSGPVLMAVDVTGGAEPEPLFKPLAPPRVLIYTLGVSGHGERFAYAIDMRDGVKNAGLYVINRTDGAPRRILTGDEMGASPTSVTFSADGRYLLLISLRDRDLDARVVDIETGAVVPVGEGENVTGVAWSPTEHALAFIVDDGDSPDHQGGLYLSPAPGEPGRQLVRGRFMTPACCGRHAISWASNHTILLGRIEDMNTVLEVRLGP